MALCAKVHLPSDSWLLYAIIHASREEPADLARIIAVGDHYNQAVFTQDELYDGLDRLISSGLVTSQKTCFSASDEALKKICHYSKPKSFLFQRNETIGRGNQLNNRNFMFF